MSCPFSWLYGVKLLTGVNVVRFLCPSSRLHGR